MMRFAKFALIDPFSLTLLLVGPYVLAFLAMDWIGPRAVDLLILTSFAHFAWIWSIFEYACRAIERAPGRWRQGVYWLGAGILILILGGGALAPAQFAEFQARADRDGMERVLLAVLLAVFATVLFTCHALSAIALLTAENGKPRRYSGYLTFLCCLYPPIGVWFLHPRIEAIAEPAQALSA